ncbi:MAG: hypothetical protein M3N43_02125 [Actinomycetota bacterium]|nr:hypothetical protein [Actinomycetota bacterium]
MTRTLLPAVALLLVAAACGQARATDQTAGRNADQTASTVRVTSPILSEDLVITAAKMSRAINQLPLKADSILAANSYTPETFEHLLHAIAADSAKSATYAAEMR